MKNRIKKLRKNLGLTQNMLAKKVGTSQQQIQRLEKGETTAQVELAVRLSAALDKPLDIVFPGAGKVLKKFHQEVPPSNILKPKSLAMFNKVGLEADRLHWSINILLRNHMSPINLQIPPAEKRRIFSTIQEESSTGEPMSFIVFDTLSHRVALNLHELSYCNFLYEVHDAGTSEHEKDDEKTSITIFFSGSIEPHKFKVEQDELGDSNSKDIGQMAHIFYLLETGVEKHERLFFKDFDGEDVFLRAGNIAMFSVPFSIIAPDEEEEKEEVVE
jgi:DNA-binding XRE family transcriptional regulator